MSPQAAMDKAASAKIKSVVMRGGTYFLTGALNVSAQHSGIRVSAYPNEKPIISGGKELKTAWKPFNTTGANIYVA